MTRFGARSSSPGSKSRPLKTAIPIVSKKRGPTRLWKTRGASWQRQPASAHRRLAAERRVHGEADGLHAGQRAEPRLQIFEERSGRVAAKRRTGGHADDQHLVGMEASVDRLQLLQG